MPDTMKRRSKREWAIDLTMTAGSFLLGLVLFFTLPGDRGDTWLTLDLLLGLAAIASLWVRRAHPVAVGVATTVVSVVSSLAGGAALCALFGATVRASRNGLAVVWSVALEIGRAHV